MIYVCADDYGMTPQSCAKIEECSKYGALNKISILPNSPYAALDFSYSEYGVTRAVHINLVEGKSLIPSHEISLLADEEGVFKHTFLGLLLLSLSHKRREFKKQIYAEMKAQITYWQNNIAPNAPIFLDSHQHVHMIPAIFKTLLRVLKEENIKAEYIRIPAEPLMPHIMTPSLYFSYKPANILKHIILSFFKLLNSGAFKKSGLKTAYFMGILFSGDMTSDKIQKILPRYIKLAEKKNADIELLFHPGYAKRGEFKEFRARESFIKFYLSKQRKKEYNTLMQINLEGRTENGLHRAGKS